MKKIVLVLFLVCSLLVSFSLAAIAKTGFYLGFGYDQMQNELTLEAPYGLFKLEINTPSKAFTVNAGYEFTNWFTLDAKYSAGTHDLASLDICELGIGIDQRNSAWQVEGVFKWDVSPKVKLGGLIGYADSTVKTKLNVSANEIAYPVSVTAASSTIFTGDLEQNYDGTYLGAFVTYQVNPKLELGAVYRYMIDPSGDLELSIYGQSLGTIDLDDLNSSIFELYARTAIGEKWSLKAAYVYSNTDYKLCDDDLKISSTTDGIKLLAEYRF